MTIHSIGQVCKLLGLKPHTLRYWEENNPLLSGRRSASGRREYTDADLDLLMRMKRLVMEKRYTVEGARRLLAEEHAGPGGAGMAALAGARRELARARARCAAGARLDIERMLGRIPGYHELAAPGRAAWLKALRGLDAGLAASVTGLLAKASPAGPPALELDADRFVDAGEEARAGAGTAFASLLYRPAYRLPALMSALNRLASVAAGSDGRSERLPRWYLFFDAELSLRLEGLVAWLKAAVDRRCRLTAVALARFPAMDLEGRFRLDADGRLLRYPSGFAGVCSFVRSSTMLRVLEREDIRRLVLLPANGSASPARCAALLAVHEREAAHLTIDTYLESGGPARRTTGMYVIDRAFLAGLRPDQVYRREVYGPGQSADNRKEEQSWRIVSNPWELAAHAGRAVAVRSR